MASSQPVRAAYGLPGLLFFAAAGNLPQKRPFVR
jgi:hypothetical protein